MVDSGSDISIVDADVFHGIRSRLKTDRMPLMLGNPTPSLEVSNRKLDLTSKTAMEVRAGSA